MSIQLIMFGMSAYIASKSLLFDHGNLLKHIHNLEIMMEGGYENDIVYPF